MVSNGDCEVVRSGEGMPAVCRCLGALGGWSQSQQGAEVACSVGGGVNAPLGLSNGSLQRHFDMSCDQRTLVTARD